MTTNIDQDKLNTFLGHVVGDMGAAMSATLVVIGDKLGQYLLRWEGGTLAIQPFCKESL